MYILTEGNTLINVNNVVGYEPFDGGIVAHCVNGHRELICSNMSMEHFMHSLHIAFANSPSMYILDVKEE